MSMKQCVTLGCVLLLIWGAVSACHHGYRPIEELVDIPRMTKEDLKARLDDPDLAIIDVRYGPNWKKSQIKIPGAVREDALDVGAWIHRYPKKRLMVLYCD